MPQHHWTGADMDAEVRGYRNRGVVQLILIIVGQAIGFAGYILSSLFPHNTLPENWMTFAILWFGLGFLIYIGSRIAVPYADPVIVPLVLTLTGIGLATLHRFDMGVPTDPPMLGSQFIAVCLGVATLFIIVFLIKNPRRLKGFPFLLSGFGVVLLLLPLIPGIGTSSYGSQIWITVGGYSFQPAEIAKIVLAASFAAYLADKREVLSSAGKSFLGIDLPRMRDLGPVLIMWGISLAIMIFQNDLGTSLLFFGLFVMMLYASTGKSSWVILGLALFGLGGVAALKFTSHVQSRFDYWLHPFDYPYDATQIIQAQFALSHGGLLGSGWGLGKPHTIILGFSDMIPAAIGEEIGIVGLMGIIMIYGILVFRGFKTALITADPFTKLFAAGLSFAFLLQTFAIIGGVTRLLPLTGLTTPFLSQGGSSMIANWILIALLLVMSHQARRPQAQSAEVGVGGVTALSDEKTQVFSTRELARVGVGEIQPVMEINAEQVRLTLAGAPISEDADFTGDEELTAAVSPDQLPDLFAAAAKRGTRRVSDIFVEETPAASPQPPKEFDEDDYFIRGEE
ncbi:MAG: FtsW/RodA/SpoVE family cell cycle protein [Propionibacteriaceae bacterium]|nr:FtsW/RodA/SpoVE family cell cycle protein [Propionibacteriaceae bacterium]